MSSNKIQSSQYQSLLNQKVLSLQNLMNDFNLPNFEVFESSPLAYRMRCEFRVWHEGDDLFHIMFDKETKEKYRVDEFPIASTLIQTAMKAVIQYLKSNDILRRKLFQIDYLSTLSGELLISLLYHKQLDENWKRECEKFKTHLNDTFKVNIIGRARKQKVVLDRDFVVEKLTVDGKQYTYKQVENSFTQPNAKVCQDMLSWAKNATNYKGDLLELYCGNGNFSIALADKFNKVLATEISKTSVASAQYNIEQNKTDNVKIIRMSAEEFTQAINGERQFTRLQGIELDSYQCNTIFVDPPRSGLDVDTVKMVAKYPTIIYISCNPHTLKDNLVDLSQTHDIEKFALFDQFPYTDHIECGVILQRKIT